MDMERGGGKGAEPASGGGGGGDGGGGGGEGAEKAETTRTRVYFDSSGSESEQPHLSSRRRGRRTGAATGRGYSSETTEDSSRSPSYFPPATISATSSAQKGKGKGKRRRMTATVSPYQLPSKRPLLGTGEHSEAEEEKHTDSSSSSPIRKPRSLLVKKTNASGKEVHVYNSDPVVVRAFHRDFRKYQKKLARLQQLPTLKECKYAPNLDWHDLKQKNAVIDVAGSVLSLSSSYGDKEINRCTGIIIERVEAEKSAIVVTSSQIICTVVSLDDWKDSNVYAPDAKVTAHLLDGSISELKLLYFSKHYDIAFFEVMEGLSLQIASLKPKFEFGHEACVLGRDTDHELICRRTILKALDPCDHQRNHYSFINTSIPKCCTGGALTTFDRNVVGMLQLARPHLGLKLRTVAFLDISHLEHLSRVFGIRSGLIVAKVSYESLAERNGIRVGDIIFSCQGQTVSTISQFEDILLDVCDKQFEKGHSLNSKVDVESLVSITCGSILGEPSPCLWNYQIVWRSLAKGSHPTSRSCCEGSAALLAGFKTIRTARLTQG
ncbi:hypothetical protein ACP70R_026076 [Stipagrostis hirtigluma subsp. patula]